MGFIQKRKYNVNVRCMSPASNKPPFVAVNYREAISLFDNIRYSIIANIDRTY